MAVHVITLLNALAAPATGTAFERRATKTTFQAKGTTTAGSGAAVVKVEVSNDNVNWIQAGAISLTLGTSETSDGFTMDAPWKYCRGNLFSISGTGAKATLLMGS